MKENLFDVLIYLFENYMDSEDEIVPDLENLRGELLQAGFHKPEINKAFDWIESLADTPLTVPVGSTPSSFRIFSESEENRLGPECRGMLFYLEQSGILNASNREVVLDRLMALDDEELSLDQVKWVVLMVLFSQPDEAHAYARMENFVYDNIPAYLH